MKTFFCLVALLLLGAWTPADLLQELQVKYDQYNEKYPAVKLNLLFNQPTYSPGDTAFLSGWYMNEAFMAVKGEHTVTLDLLSGNGSTAQRTRFKVRNGKGNSQIVFRNELTPGTYTLVAYTDWMKNFGNTWFYQKSIPIVSKNQFSTKKKQDERITFYPEGGNLIEGIATKVVVTGPPAIELIVHDGQQSEVTKVQLDSTGLGSFVITPQANQKYAADWPAPGKGWPLPDPKKDGISVRAGQKDLLEIQLSIPTNSAWAGKEIYAIVIAAGKMSFKQRITLKESESLLLQIPKFEKSDVLHQLYVFGADGKILAQRIFVPTVSKSIELKMKFPSEVKQRESIAGSLEVLDGSGHLIESDVRVTVYQKKLFRNQSLGNDFYLSDLPQAAEWAEKAGSRHQAFLNDFLITQRWQRTNWDAILSNKAPEFQFPFQSQAKLRGEVISKTNGSFSTDSTFIISYLQGNSLGFEAQTFDGKFEVPFIFDFYGDDRAFCTLQYRGKNIDDNYYIKIAPDTLTLPDSWTSTETIDKSAYGEYAFSKQLVAKSYTFFGGGQKGPSLREQNPNLSIEEEFSGVDYGIKVADYVVFPKMEDLLREVIPFVQYRKRGTKETVRMSFRLETSTRTYTDDPLYVIDGFMSRNTAFFISLKPENVISIKIINNPNKLAQFGRLGENGIIFVETKKREYSASVLKANTFPVVGLSRPANYNVVSYSNANSNYRVPDMRSTLYWNPSLETDKTGRAEVNFFASDDIGPVRILVQGLTKDGRPFTAEQEIRVSFSSQPK